MRRYRTQFFLFIFFSILAATAGLILYARGYKLDLAKKTLKPTGLLVATSIPNGASVIIDSQLITATNNTISLAPGEYQVEIRKDSYLSWKKTLKIEKEVVTKVEAYLFPSVPELRPLTYTGVKNPLLSPDGSKILYSVPFSDQDELTIKAGLWVLDMAESPFGLSSREPRQIVKSAPQGRDFSQAEYQWSPDSKQILVTLKKGETEENLPLDPNQLTTVTQLIDVSDRLPIIIKQWQNDAKDKEIAQLAKLPKDFQELFQSSTAGLSWSPDNSKVLYTATDSANLAENPSVKVLGASTQKQERSIKLGKIYTYDIKEDRNFYIMEIQDTGYGIREKEERKSSYISHITYHISPLSWFPTSNHLILVEPEKITIRDYDGTNQQTVYSGFFEYPYVFPATADKLILLTRLTSDEKSPLNLYALSLR